MAEADIVALADTKLSQHDLPQIYEKLRPYSSKWRRIGQDLGFTDDELSSIESAPLLLADAPYSWLHSMLSSWLLWVPGDARGSRKCASMKSLRRAVDRAGLGLVAQLM